MSDNPQEPHGTNTDPEKGLTEEWIASISGKLDVTYTDTNGTQARHNPFLQGRATVIYGSEPKKEYGLVYGTADKPIYQSTVTIEGYDTDADGRPVIILRDMKTGNIIRIIVNEDGETDTD